MKRERNYKKILSMICILCMMAVTYCGGFVAFADGDVSSPASSTDLSQFLINVTINAELDENGNYIVDPNGEYEMTLSFSENESVQFDDEGVMTYDLPAGLFAGNHVTEQFFIAVTDNEGTVMVAASYEIEDGKIKVVFDQNDPNFQRLKAAANANFQLTVKASFDQSENEIIFSPEIVKDFVFESTSDLNITKSVIYDQDSDTATYVLQVTSVGLNENVVIEDHLTGTALIFNQDVTISSSIHGAITVNTDYATVDNGFRITIPSMVNGETLTIRYTATVDNDKITGKGTVAQTNNTASVLSHEVPDGKEVSADFAGQVNFHKINKVKVGEPVLLEDGRYEVTWLIRVNIDHKMTSGGNEIKDWISSVSQPFMHFTGDGIMVEVIFEDETTEIYSIPWSELTTVSDSIGITGWSYVPPAADGNATYLITCKSIIDTTDALGSLTVVNRASFLGNDDYAEQTVVVNDSLTILKEAVGTTATESEWKITVVAPASGLPDLRVVDSFPRVTYGGTNYYDGYVDGSMTVDGLLPGETWDLYVGSSGTDYTLTFYQDEGKTQKGIQAIPDGENRELVIRFKTSVNQDWLGLAEENEYQNGDLSVHYNRANARSLDYRTKDTGAIVVPIHPDIVKEFIEKDEVEIEGVTYPVFRYTLGVYGPTEDGAAIHDAFNTTYLKFFEDEGIQLLGGMSFTPTDGDGEISVVETSSGMDILVDSFPKMDNGAFYPYYKIKYALIVKDAETLLTLNEAAASSQNGVLLDNTVTWNDLESSAEYCYTNYPYVDKELINAPNAENGYVAEFRLYINKNAEDLDPSSDVIVIRDVLSSNLRLLPDSLEIIPSGSSIEVNHDADTNTLTFLNVPDETTFEITYKARVLGSGNVTYSNTIQFGKYEKTIAESATVTSYGGGTASNPSITLVKRDADSITNTLAGASFQLYYTQEYDLIPVLDKDGSPVIFTTGADGTVLIVGNQQSLGWTLWTDRTYCLVETNAPAGYEPNNQPTYFVLSNTPSSQIEYDITGDQLNINNEPEKVNVPVVKTWVGTCGARDVTVRLMADDKDTDMTITLTKADNWTGSFDGLRKYDSEGNEIRYSVKEEPLQGYAPQYEITADGTCHIVNISTETIDIPVTKQWIGPALSSVIINLKADGVVITEIELNDYNQWQNTFTDLPKYDQVDGHEIKYELEEVNVTGYSSIVTPSGDGSYTITNINTETISIPVEKQWVGPALNSIIINLTADDEIIAEIELSDRNQWSYTFIDLPKYDQADGHRILYDVQEIPVEGYETGRSGTAETGFTFTNTITGKVSVPVTKIWVGQAQDRVTIELLANGDIIDEAVLSAENQWQYTFTDLEQYEAGVEIQYAVREVPMEGYSSETIETDNGFIIKNTNTATIEVSVEKKWVGTAKDQVTIRLYADGQETGHVVLNASNKWRHTFTDLTKYDPNDGHEITYTISEDKVEGYTTTITGGTSGKFIVTNTRNTTIGPPKTGDELGLWMYIALATVALTAVIVIEIVTKKRTIKRR